MTAKEYLSQAYKFDQRITSKLQQVETLRALTTRATAAYNSEPVSHTRNVASMQDTIIVLMEAEDDLNRQIDHLVSLKTAIAAQIARLDNMDYQLVLEKRYLSFLSWEQIAVDMNYGLRWTHIIHGRALQEMEKILEKGGVSE